MEWDFTPSFYLETRHEGSRLGRKKVQTAEHAATCQGLMARCTAGVSDLRGRWRWETGGGGSVSWTWSLR